MKRILVTLFIYCITQTLFSQTALNTVFKDAVAIDNENVATNGFDYILNVVLEIPNQKELVIANNASMLPNKILFHSSLVNRFNSVTVISPDWVYYKAVSSIKDVNCAEPSPSFRVYKIIKGPQNKISIDSTITYRGTFPTIEYRKSKETAQDKLLIYYTENWGSICCPKDPKWDRIKEIEAFKKQFRNYESKTYLKNRGKEGEHEYYYTLEKLELKDRLNFILKSRSYDEKPNTKKLSPELYFPYYISNYDLTEVK